MVPHTVPPQWPTVRPGRFASTVVRSDGADCSVAARGCPVALLGLPDDTGVALNHGRVGARQGPSAFRAALATYGAASPALPRVFDAGDIVPGDTLDDTHRRITAAVAAILDLGFFPVGIGGGHDLTFPFVRAVALRCRGSLGPMAGVYLDAHLDVRAEAGSGMPFRRLIEDCGVTALTCVGADPFANAPEHLAWFSSHGGSLLTPGDAEREASEDRIHIRFDSDAPHFVSIDLDCLNVAHAPGVSAINPVGLTPGVVAAYAFHAGRSRSVRCFDIMELNPTYDIDGRTARLAAHLFLQFLRGYGERSV